MSFVARAAVLAVRGYQRLVSPLLPASCRFAPACSEYAAQAITHHGLVRGIGLTVRRLARCHPFHPGGFDPPPMARRRE
ncbi:MAG: membrane protein insertion efficiency factor YidD [Candidatus Rokubacteria bacterium]|nr:membrane protein insertion efficiency factor YidD [Candidatus Rokubacteria bacterium]